MFSFVIRENTQVRVQVTEFNGIKRLDVRQFFLPNGDGDPQNPNDWKPTKTGFLLPLTAQVLDGLIAELLDIRTKLPKAQSTSFQAVGEVVTFKVG